MHPAVLSAQPTTMVPYPVFQSPVNLRHLDYHPLMFPFHQQLALHAQSGTFQYSLSGLPFQGSGHVFEEQGSRATKSGSSFTIDAILSSKRNKQELLTPESSPVSRKVSNSHQRRHERIKNFSLPYGRSPTRPELSESPKSGCDLPISADSIEKKSGCNDWKSVRAKRIRTIFTPEQLERLETEFERQQYMVGTERYYLATELNLTEAQVKVWFQNRRIKWRKQTLEKQQAQLAASDVYHGVHSDSEAESADDLSANKHNDIESPSVLQKD